MIVNAHHFADQIVEYLAANQNFGMHIEVSREEALLDTGGGLKKAAHFFAETSSSADEPFILHNVDVISTIDLHRMAQCHSDNQPLATLAVQKRDTSRYLLFDERMQLCGRRAGSGRKDQLVGATNPAHALAFCGIHVISPRIFSLMMEQGEFSIIDAYLRLATAGEKIIAFRADKYYWRDLGTPQNVALAAEDLRQGALR